MAGRAEGVVRIGITYDRVRLGAKRTNSRRIVEAAENIIGNHGAIDVLVTQPYPITGPVVGYYPEERAKSYIKSNAERLSTTGTAQGQTFTILSRIADTHNVHVISGPILERAGPRLYVTSFHVAPGGRLMGKYRKLGVTREELKYSINPGREGAVFEVKGVRIGVFVDEDLALPGLFRFLQLSRVNLIVGFMLPYDSAFFTKVVDEQTKLTTMDRGHLYAALRYVSRMTGVPVVLVGGVVEGTNGQTDIAYTPLVIMDPDAQVAVSREYSEVGKHVRIELDASSSVSRACDLACEAEVELVARTLRRARRARSASYEE